MTFLKLVFFILIEAIVQVTTNLALVTAGFDQLSSMALSFLAAVVVGIAVIIEFPPKDVMEAAQKRQE